MTPSRYSWHSSEVRSKARYSSTVNKYGWEVGARAIRCSSALPCAWRSPRESAGSQDTHPGTRYHIRALRCQGHAVFGTPAQRESAAFGGFQRIGDGQELG